MFPHGFITHVSYRIFSSSRHDFPTSSNSDWSLCQRVKGMLSPLLAYRSLLFQWMRPSVPPTVIEYDPLPLDPFTVSLRLFKLIINQPRFLESQFLTSSVSLLVSDFRCNLQDQPRLLSSHGSEDSFAHAYAGGHCVCHDNTTMVKMDDSRTIVE